MTPQGYWLETPKEGQNQPFSELREARNSSRISTSKSFVFNAAFALSSVERNLLYNFTTINNANATKKKFKA